MPDTKFLSDAAQVIGLFVQALLHGLYLVTFAAALKCILAGPQQTWVGRIAKNATMFTVVNAMFVFSTFNLALGLVRILQGLVYHPVELGGGGAIKQLGQDWINIVKPLTVHLQTMTADAVLIYRCWVVYDQSYKIAAFPALLWLGQFGVTCYAMYLQGILTFGSRVIGGNLSHAYIGFWSATIALNIYATSLIVLRIWRALHDTVIAHQLSPFATFHRHSRLESVMRIIIESGLMYTVISVIVFATQQSGSNSVYITTAAEIEITGIAFNLIQIRAKEASDQATTGAQNTSTGMSFAPPPDSASRAARLRESTLHAFDSDEKISGNTKAEKMLGITGSEKSSTTKGGV